MKSKKIKIACARFLFLMLGFGLLIFSVAVEVRKNPVVAVAATVSAEGSYYLVYPGVLPDHPLYWLKMVRDRIALWLTRGKVERVERLLLYADKRLGAAEALVEGNKAELAVATATKAEKYMERVVAGLAELEGETELKERVELAAKKHVEVLMGMREKLPISLAGVIEQLIPAEQVEEVIQPEQVEQVGEATLPAELQPTL